MVESWYEGLAAERLRRCYEIASPEVRDYLDAEVEYLLASMPPRARVLELGCGYGRVLARLAGHCGWLAGVDLTISSLLLAKRESPSASLAAMDAAALSFREGTFDVVCCPQNGISAFHSDPRALIASAVRILTAGGRAHFFSYADSFWEQRLAWFRLQAAEGLVGEIDEERTADGTIVCRDGFTATTVSAERFLEITRGLGAGATVSVLRGSSVVCTISA